MFFLKYNIVFIIIFTTIYLEIKTISTFFSIFLEKKNNQKVSYFLYIVYGVISYVRTNYIELPFVFNTIITMVLVFILCQFLYTGSIWMKIISSAIYCFCVMFIVSCIVMVMPFFFEINYSEYFIGVILSTICCYILVISLKKFLFHAKIQEVSTKYNMILLLVPVSSMAMIDIMLEISRYIPDNRKIWLAILFIILLSINLVVFILYFKIIENSILKRENSVYEKQVELYEKHQQEKEMSMLQLRNIKHNIKNHFIMIYSFIKNKKYTEAMNFIEQQLNQELSNKNEVSNTGNLVVDSMLNYFYATSLKKEIEFKINTSIPIQFSFKGVDISLILGNILDNALEAAEKSDKKFISITLKYNRGNLLITVCNSYNGVIKIDKNGNLMTQKIDKDNHGIGLKTVRKAIEKYHGHLSIEYDTQIFTAKVLLYGTELI